MILKLPLAVDVSHYHLIPDWKTIFPVPFLTITKATEGINYIDPTFVRYMIGMRDAGYKRGAYHFNRKIYSGADQARHFIDVCGTYVDDETLLILDIEEGREQASQLWSWLETVRAKYPRNRLMLYSRRNILEAIPMTTPEKEYFRRIPVWVAGYPANPDIFDYIPGAYIPDPTRFGPPVLWQYSDAGQVAGISGDCDVNWIDPVFEKLLRGTTQPQEENMTQIIKGTVLADALNIRQTASGEAYNPARYLRKGDTIEASENSYQWLHLTFVNGTPAEGWASAGATGQYINWYKVDVTPPPPPVVEPVKVPFTLAVAGYKPFNGELEKA